MAGWSFSIAQMMAGIAALGVVLGLLKLHVTLGTVAGCVAVMTAIRVRDLARGTRTSRGWWARAVAGSVVVSAAIVATACLAFVFVYAAFNTRELHALPSFKPVGVVAGAPSGVLAGYIMRRWLWIPRRRQRPAEESVGQRGV
jgi:membrane associated rhomboid family serine protease